MSEDEIRQRIAQDIATEIRRLVGLLETLTVNREAEENDIQVVEAQVIPQQQVPEQEIVPQPEEVRNEGHSNRDITVDDRVLITNHYGRQRGQTGTVIGVTPRQVILRLEGSQAVITKRKTSVVVIED